MKDKNIRPIYEKHYDWCIKEGRDTKWYDDYKRGDYDIRVATPKVFKEIKKQNNLTNNKNYDKGIDNENIQSKNSSLPTRTERNTSIRSRTKPRTT